MSSALPTVLMYVYSGDNKACHRMVQCLTPLNCCSVCFPQTIVGGALIKGISGGERKRTSVGVELVVKPALVFLDEPVSFSCFSESITVVVVAHYIFVDVWSGCLFGSATVSSSEESGKRWCECLVYYPSTFFGNLQLF